ncbi:MAG: FMN-binding negative transcriptional regulator [Pseudomonadota bacterium]
MHPNPAFRASPRDRDIAFVQDRSFGILSLNADPVPLVSHIPFQLSDDGRYADAHVLRSNPIWRMLKDPTPAKLIVSGGDCYVSPDWYGVDDQVPTWNYIAIHLTGTLRRLAQRDLRGVLDRLSGGMETRIDGKIPWKIDKMTRDIYTRMERQIVPIAFDVTDITSTWKLSQNKPDAVKTAAKTGIAKTPMGSDVTSLLRHM